MLSEAVRREHAREQREGEGEMGTREDIETGRGQQRGTARTSGCDFGSLTRGREGLSRIGECTLTDTGWALTSECGRRGEESGPEGKW